MMLQPNDTKPHTARSFIRSQTFAFQYDSACVHDSSSFIAVSQKFNIWIVTKILATGDLTRSGREAVIDLQGLFFWMTTQIHVLFLESIPLDREIAYLGSRTIESLKV